MKIITDKGTQLECDTENSVLGTVANIYFVKTADKVIKLYKFPEKINIKSLSSLINFHDKIYKESYFIDRICWPECIVMKPQLGVVFPAVKGRLHTLNWFINPKALRQLPVAKRGNWYDRLQISLQIAKIVDYLHSFNMVLTDIAPRNFLVSLVEQKVTMIDCDGIIAPNTYSPHVLGTPGYQAPEVLNGNELNKSSDLHSLATTIYQVLFLRHPLLGIASYTDDPEMDEQLLLGKKAIFIEHPGKAINRPVDYRIKASDFGAALNNIILQSFVEGLHNPQKRPRASQWVSVLSSLSESLYKCNNPKCVGKYFFSEGIPDKCYWCGQKLQIQHNNYHDIHAKITKHFNLEELRTLCFDLGIDDENFPPLKESFARELLGYSLRRESISELIDYCQKKRPSISW